MGVAVVSSPRLGEVPLVFTFCSPIFSPHQTYHIHEIRQFCFRAERVRVTEVRKSNNQLTKALYNIVPLRIQLRG